MAKPGKYATLPYDIYACARHGTERKDAGLVTFYLCDECSEAFTNGAFNGTGPVFEGPHFEGYCALCNQQLSDVSLRQWYLCGVCERVARSMGRGRVAAQYVLDWWVENMRPIAPNLELKQTDPIVLRPTGAGEGQQAKADFTAIEAESRAEVLTIELKTGRSAVNAMSAFQLDTTDCDDILAVVGEKEIPGYVFHAMVVEQFSPPTSRFKAVGLWWSDVFRMSEAFQSVRRRQVEQRYAAYFKRTCFDSMTSFLERIRERDYERLAHRLRDEGVPAMYELPGSE